MAHGADGGARNADWNVRLPGGVQSALLLAFLLLASACSRSDTAQVDEIDSLVVGYWQLPLAHQGDAPPGWNDVESSLKPEDCARCHPDQYGDWSSAFHAKAFSPGFVGQLINFDFGEVAACLECHAPLAEQRRDFEMAQVAGLGHDTKSQGLAASGNGCAGCHIREHRRFGPPQRETGLTGQSSAVSPHGGVYRTKFFESSEFCKECHQFPQELAINGKPLENTYVEWQSSPQAAEGTTCQGCHMPDRRHLWRGIHDPDMVASGLEAKFDTDPQRARFQIASTGVGHAFPTYITPKVIMRAVALDANRMPRVDTETAYVIQRRVENVDGEWVERFDTRLMPGQTATLDIEWQGSDRVRVWLDVHPDDYYDHYVYDVLLDQQIATGAAARLISEADRLAQASRFRLFETELERPKGAQDGANYPFDAGGKTP
jgi:hypothetical protein